mmetsp:Transcript_3007/g.6840  ORF Transcript_3007/g.6840 Transcript_3007/m.6840 type:complete len:200 (+) Transcript_3007:407-1006(+)
MSGTLASWSSLSCVHSPASGSQLSTPPFSVHVMSCLFKGPQRARFTLTPGSILSTCTGFSFADVSNILIVDGSSPQGSASTATLLSPVAIDTHRTPVPISHFRSSCPVSTSHRRAHWSMDAVASLSLPKLTSTYIAAPLPPLYVPMRSPSSLYHMQTLPLLHVVNRRSPSRLYLTHVSGPSWPLRKMGLISTMFLPLSR